MQPSPPKVEQYRVAICRFPGGGSEVHQVGTWLMMLYHAMQTDPRISEVVSIVLDDTPITMTRNRAVKQALAAKCDYILMIDSDMCPDNLYGIDPSAKRFWPTEYQ